MRSVSAASRCRCHSAPDALPVTDGAWCRLRVLACAACCAAVSAACAAAMTVDAEASAAGAPIGARACAGLIASPTMRLWPAPTSTPGGVLVDRGGVHDGGYALAAGVVGVPAATGRPLAG